MMWWKFLRTSFLNEMLFWKRKSRQMLVSLIRKVDRRFTEGLKSYTFEPLSTSSFLPSSLCWLFLSPHRAAAVIGMLSRAVTQVMFTLEPEDRNLRQASLFKLNSQACSSKTYMIDCSFDIGPSCWPYRVRGSEQIWWAGAWCLHWRQEKTDLMLVHCHPVNWIQYTRPALTDPDPSFQGWPSSMENFCSAFQLRLRLASPQITTLTSRELTSTKWGKVPL